MNRTKACCLSAVLLLASNVAFADARPNVPDTSSLDGWRSADGLQAWQVDPQAGALVYADHRPGSLVAAEPCWETAGAAAVRFRKIRGPSARFEMRFRGGGDQRDYCSVVLKPQQRRLELHKITDGRKLEPAVSKSADLPEGIDWSKPHTIGYRIAGRRATLLFDDRQLLSADGVVPTHAGHIGLAVAYAVVEVLDLKLSTAMPHIVDHFDSLDDWSVYYGPEAWSIAASPSAKASADSPAPADQAKPNDSRAAVFSAEADGALIGMQEGTHFTAEVRGKFVEILNPWTCFGLRPKVTADRGSFYVVELRGKQNSLVLWKQLDGRRDPAVDHSVKVPRVEPGQWHTLRCTLQGNRIVVQFDGKTLLDVIDPAPIRSGRTAISASHGTIQVDSFRQQELESDYRFELAEPDVQPYDAGPALPPRAGLEAGKRSEADEHYWYLCGKAIHVAVHRRTGMIAGIGSPDREAWPIRRALNLYKFETRSSAVTSDAYGDRVAHVEQADGSELLLRCNNPAMPGIEIRKRYHLDEAGRKLIQEVSLSNDTDRPDVFVTVAQRAVLDDAYRRQAIYTGGSYFGPLVPANSLQERELTDAFKNPWVRGITNGRPSWILALNHEAGPHFAAYRYRVNGQYVLPWNSIWTEELNNLYHTPLGWEMGIATLHLQPGRPRSVEVHHMPFRGSRLDFYHRYMDLPEVRAMYARVNPRPEWLAEIKAPVYVPNQYRLSHTEDGILLNLRHPFAVWGDLPSSGTVRTAGGVARWPVERVRQTLRDAKALSPRIKTGCYTWAWSAHRHSQIVAEHPEWFIRTDKSGNERNAYPLAMSYLRCLSAPGCLEATIATYHDLVRFYEEDFQYLDNDGTGVQIIDWEHLRIDQDYHWQRLHEGILAAARARSPETATFFNNRILPQGDISFAEFMTEEIQNTNWRRPANEMMPLKIFQKRDPQRVVALLYWRKENEPGYVNYCVGLGLMPFDDRLEHLPFVNAAFETRRFEIMDAGLTPDWQRDLETDVEAYTFRQGNAAVVPTIGHRPTPEDVDISFDSARIGLQPGRSYTTWLFELKHPRNHVGRLNEQLQRDAYAQAHWAEELVVAGRQLEAGSSLPERYVRRVTTRPQQLRVLVVTHCPALVWSIDGQRTNFWLPSVRKVDCSGRWTLDEGRAEITCRCGHDRAELVVPILSGQEVAELTLDGQPVAWGVERVGGAWLARFGVDRGKHHVDIRFRPRPKTPALTGLTLKLPERLTAGAPLLVEATWKNGLSDGSPAATVRLQHEGIVVTSTAAQRLQGTSAAFELPTPETARPGVYEAILSVVGSPTDEARMPIEVLPSQWKPAKPPTAKRGSPALKVWDVNHTINGLRVLRAGTDTFDHRGGVQIAELDLEKLAARCGLEVEAQSPWGYGFCGIEVEGTKAIDVELQNNFSQPHQEGTDLATPCPDTFAGVIVDYHTTNGYTYRVALGLGLQQDPRPVQQPHWGKSSRPDRVIQLSKTILEKPRDRIRIDLKQYAPDNWDGRAWISLGVDTVIRGLELNATFAAP